MRRSRLIVLAIVLFIAGQPLLAADVTEFDLPPDVLRQFEGRTLPSMEELARSGLVYDRPLDVKTDVSELGYITQWLSHYRMLIGGLDEDLIGEGDIGPTCYGSALTEHEMAPSMYRYYYTYPEMWNSHWNAFEDEDACERIYTNQVRYYITQVKSTTETNALLLVGADDGIKVWLNGEVVVHQEGGEYAPAQYRAEVRLLQGWNLVVVKLHFPSIGPPDDPDYHDRRWSVRFSNESGSEPIQLIQSLDPQCGHDESTMWVYAGGVADLPGAFGSQWASDLRLTNPYAFPLEVTVEYYREGEVGPAPAKSTSGSRPIAAPDAQQTTVLQPFESLSYRRVLTSFLGVTPPQKGMLAIGGYYYYDVQQWNAAELRTYNQSDDGTFGTAIPMGYVYTGSTCCSHTLYGLRNGPDFRTNIAMTPRRVLDAEVEFTVTIWDSVTEAFAQKDFIGRGPFQLNDIFNHLGLEGVVTDTAMAFVEWDWMEDGPYVLFSASVVDNHTSDPVDVGKGYWFRPPPLQ